jgi:hypothetical protein
LCGAFYLLLCINLETLTLRVLIVAVILSFVAQHSFAQAVPDTSLKQVIPDSARAADNEIKSLPNDAAGEVYQPQPWQPNPKKAGLYSAILPGAGQLYNKQYWKIPVIYVGVAAAVYFTVTNNNKYQKYRKAYIATLENKENEFSGIYDQAALQQLQDGYKRYLDMTVLFTAVGYTLQVIDAVVFAHLKNFDVSKDISLRLQPVAAPNGGAGLGLVVNFDRR